MAGASMVRSARAAGKTVGIALLAMTLGLTACGDDDEAAQTTTTREQTTTTADQAGQQKQQYCEKSLALETLSEPQIDFESLSPAQQRDEAKKFASQKILPLVNEIEPLVPPEIKRDADLLIASTRTVAQTGDFSVFEKPEVQAAEQRLHAYDLQNCGWKRIDVTGTEYAFQGVPSSLPAGATSFELANRGKEAHEIVVLRIKDEVTESLEELLKLPEEQARQKVDVMGSSSDVPPGEPGYVVADLKKGRYGLACFLPVGGGQEGPPHVTRGMFAAFTVS